MKNYVTISFDEYERLKNASVNPLIMNINIYLDKDELPVCEIMENAVDCDVNDKTNLLNLGNQIAKSLKTSVSEELINNLHEMKWKLDAFWASYDKFFKLSFFKQMKLLLSWKTCLSLIETVELDKISFENACDENKDN